MTTSSADNQLKAPFPWFGGKSRAAAEVSAALGAVHTYCEPFAGSLGVLLQRAPVRHEVVNDTDGWLVNFWRAVRAAPAAVAGWCVGPVTELDLSARHAWLVREGPRLRALMEADPTAFDAQAAGWWVWGLCAWIGTGWCTGDGAWQVVATADGPRLQRVSGPGAVARKLPHLGDAGMGVHSLALGADVFGWFAALASRLERVRVCCGDFERVLSHSVLRAGLQQPVIGVLLDPPYPAGVEQEGFYAGHKGVATEVWERAVAWAAEHGAHERMRIVVCGYEGMWEPPAGWTTRAWHNQPGYRRQAGQRQEMLWCSPHCVKPDKRQLELF